MYELIQTSIHRRSDKDCRFRQADQQSARGKIRLITILMCRFVCKAGFATQSGFAFQLFHFKGLIHLGSLLKHAHFLSFLAQFIDWRRQMRPQ